MQLTVQDLVASARAAIIEIDGERLAQLQASCVPIVDLRQPPQFPAGHNPAP